ncbi:MBL fold metallo-hydrolase [Salinicola halophyticus]|uniref:MBL fold metallo-hydrolase n=1 Tax=Salinicola halophyticus TaxID=1808881 RepID=UPI003F457F40
MREETRQSLASGLTSVRHNQTLPVAPDVTQLTLKFVNVCFIAEPSRQRWVLIDTALPRQESQIVAWAERIFGNLPPAAIILTHGHFDHVGSAMALSRHWQVPLYAHTLEFPYLTGAKPYPPADASAGGGAISQLSPIFPRGPFHLEDVLSPLPEDGSVPGLDSWRWIPTPGHTPGHVSLFREEDRTLVAGDAFVTVQQESLHQVVLQRARLSGPPRYFTQDWEQAFESIRHLAALKPAVVTAGHGPPIGGALLTNGLAHMIDHFHVDHMPKR